MTDTIKIAFEIKGKPTVVTVDADIIGPLAVHPTLNEEGFWTVTHIKTRCALYRFFPSRAKAKSLASKLAADPAWKGGRNEIEADEQLKALVTLTMNAMGVRAR